MYLLNFYKYYEADNFFLYKSTAGFQPDHGIQMCCGRPLIKKIVLVFICCCINWSFEQALQDIMDSYFSIPVHKPGQQYVKRARLSLLETKKTIDPRCLIKMAFSIKRSPHAPYGLLLDSKTGHVMISLHLSNSHVLYAVLPGFISHMIK